MQITNCLRFLIKSFVVKVFNGQYLCKKYYSLVTTKLIFMTSRLSNNDRLLRFAPRKIKNKNKYKLKRNQLNRATSCLLANHACA